MIVKIKPKIEPFGGGLQNTNALWCGLFADPVARDDGNLPAVFWHLTYPIGRSQGKSVFDGEQQKPCAKLC